MQTGKCSNCGADIDYAAKFCRQCGQATAPSELTTRNLEEPPQFDQPSRFQSQTRPANSWSTSPTYLPPDAMPPQVIMPGSMESSSQKKTVIALAAVIAVLVIALTGIGLYLVIGRPGGPPFIGGTPQDGPPGATMPPPRIPGPAGPAPPAPNVPGGIPVPQPPSAPVISGDFIYPGAKVTMDMSGGTKGRVLKLNTPDAIDTVTDWYIKKIGSAKQVRIPGGSTVLSGEGVAAVITVEGSETSILLTLKNK